MNNNYIFMHHFLLYLNIMETIINNNNISDSNKIFFKNLRDYIEIPLYFYGSIQRFDYINGKSDIDICIFSDNEISTINKLSFFLLIPKYEFKKFVYSQNNIQIYGYKLKYKNEVKNLKIEFLIYNNKFKNFVLDDKKKHIFMPFYISFLLYLLKNIYYYTNFISKDSYWIYKRFIINNLNGDYDKKFVLLD